MTQSTSKLDAEEQKLTSKFNIKSSRTLVLPKQAITMTNNSEIGGQKGKLLDGNNIQILSQKNHSRLT